MPVFQQSFLAGCQDQGLCVAGSARGKREEEERDEEMQTLSVEDEIAISNSDGSFPVAGGQNRGA